MEGMKVHIIEGKVVIPDNTSELEAGRTLQAYKMNSSKG